MANKPVGAAQVKAEILAAEVIEYARLNSLYAQTERDRKSLRDSLVERLEAGAVCPTCTPYILILTHQERSTYGWKEICAAILELLGERLKSKALQLIATMQADKTEVAQLNIKANPDWEGQ